MPDLYLEFLGPPIVRTGSGAAPVPASLQPFLAFLSLENERGCHRDRIIDCLWPYVSGEQGRRRLNTTVWRARLLLGDRHREAIVSTRAGYIALDRNVLEIDVEPTVNALSDVRRTAAAHGESQALEELRAAVLVDARQFLAGNYDDWVVQARQRLELAVLKGLETLLDMASTPDEAIRWARMLLRRDPLREDAHRRLIRLYADAGRRADALRQYETCVRALREELGVDPLIETTLVAAAVREGIAPLPAKVADPRRALCALREALNTCQVAVDEIELALTALPPD